MIKKANAIISLLCCLSLLGHFTTMTYSMLTGWYDYAICKNLAHLTAICVSIHVVLVFIIFFFLHDGSGSMRYAKDNIRTIAQRFSGLLIIILLHAHVKDYRFIMASAPFPMMERIRICIMEMLFFIAVFIHVSTSFSRIFISLGIVSDVKKIKAIDMSATVFCLVSMIVVIITMLRFVLNFGA